MSEAEVTKNAEDVSHGSRAILLQQTLPYVAVLTLAVVGVAYTNISHSLSHAIGSFWLWRQEFLRRNRMGTCQG